MTRLTLSIAMGILVARFGTSPDLSSKSQLYTVPLVHLDKVMKHIPPTP